MNMADEQADGMRQLDAHSSLHSSSVSDSFGWAKDDWFGVRVRFELGWGGATGPREGDGNNNTKAPKEGEGGEGEGAHGWECFFSTGQGGIQRGPSPSEIRGRAGQKRSDCSPDGPLASGCRSSRQSPSISPLSYAAGRGVVLAGELRLTAQMPHTIRRTERRLPPRLRPSV